MRDRTPLARQRERLLPLPVTTDALTTQGIARAARTIMPLVIFVVLPFVIAVAQWSDLSDRFDTHGFDFRGTLWEPARAVLDGSSPYPDPDDPSIVTGNPSVYPPLAIVVSIALARIDSTPHMSSGRPCCSRRQPVRFAS